MSEVTCPKHGEGFGEPCYMCVDEENRALREHLAAAEEVLDRVLALEALSQSAVVTLRTDGATLGYMFAAARRAKGWK